jgi:hypothetical protein
MWSTCAGGTAGRVWFTATLLWSGGLLAGPLVMAPVYRAFGSAVGDMGLLSVELIFALLPLAGLFVGLVGVARVRFANPARAATVFTALFFVAIAVCIALTPVHPVFAWLGLASAFRPAVAASVDALGVPTQAVVLGMYVAFDLLLCALAGLAADRLLPALRVGRAHDPVAPPRKGPTLRRGA